MYLQYFGLKEKPFLIPPDPQYLYLSRSHQEALAHLQYGLKESGGFVQLTGEVGTGKTLLIRALVERLPADVEVALILYPVLTVAEFIAAICDELEVPHPGEHTNLKQLIGALNAHLLQTHARGWHTVLIIDEAQNLNREVLEQIRLLTNLETTKKKLLQIILIGQPELASLLAQQDLRQLAQRITARYRLTPLTSSETRDYIVHRCRVAGARTSLFNKAVMRRAYALSGGIPRLINIICDRALLGAYAREKNVVDTHILGRAAAEVGSSALSRRRLTWRVWAPTIAVLVLIASVVGWWWRPDWIQPLLPPDHASTLVSTKTVPASHAEGTTPVPASHAEGTTPVVASNASAVAAAKAVPIVDPPKPSVTLESLLESSQAGANTDSAMMHLFERWGLDYAALPGNTGCERALNAGLHCIYKTGTWNNLLSYNRPAVIELQDKTGRKYQLLVTSLSGDSVQLELGNTLQDFSLTEVGHLWFGKYLLLWKPPTPNQETLRLGDRGESIIWLRDALARSRREPLASDSTDLFDKALRVQLRAFQRRQRLAVDGVAGKITLAQLQGFLPGKSPTLSTDAAIAEMH
ncbi:MAG: ExeA family protein [Sulfuricaulis sp.]